MPSVFHILEIDYMTWNIFHKMLLYESLFGKTPLTASGMQIVSSGNFDASEYNLCLLLVQISQ